MNKTLKCLLFNTNIIGFIVLNVNIFCIIIQNTVLGSVKYNSCFFYCLTFIINYYLQKKEKNNW